MTNKKQEDNLEFRFKLVIGLFCIVGFVVGAVWTTYNSNLKSDEFPQIFLNEVITDTVTSALRERGCVRVTFHSGIKKTIYSPKDLVSFIRIGDCLKKPANSDSMLIIRNNVVHRFKNGRH